MALKLIDEGWIDLKIRQIQYNMSLYENIQEPLAEKQIAGLSTLVGAEEMLKLVKEQLKPLDNETDDN